MNTKITAITDSLSMTDEEYMKKVREIRKGVSTLNETKSKISTEVYGQSSSLKLSDEEYMKRVREIRGETN